MQVLCLGDVVIADGHLPRDSRLRLGSLSPGPEARILLNWEIPVGETTNPVPRVRGPRLVASPDAPRSLEGLAPGFATLATNHILDAGAAGVAGTMQALERAGFATVGAGRTREEAAKPLFWETPEGRLAVVNWVFGETHPDWMALPGPNCWPGVEEARGTVRALKHETDWVLAVVHWSDEYFAYPRPEDRTIARELAQMGVDLVVGHHPHVVRGMEIIGSCPVFYSIGNFYFDAIPGTHARWGGCAAPRNREGLGVEISFRRGLRPEWAVRSFWQAGGQTTGDPSRRAVLRMEQVSHPLRQLPRAGYGEWYAARRARFDRWDYRWQFGLWNSRKTGRLMRLLQRCQRGGIPE